MAKVLYFGGSEDPEVDTNARRIVACVNACEGINPDAVPELLEACKLITEGIDDIEVFDYEKGQLAVGLRAARRAIRKAEEEIR